MPWIREGYELTFPPKTWQAAAVGRERHFCQPSAVDERHLQLNLEEREREREQLCFLRHRSLEEDPTGRPGTQKRPEKAFSGGD